MHKYKKCAFSVKQFYTFLSIARKRGLLAPEKLHSWQEALREFQAVMQPSEQDDLRSIDIESVSERYIERVSKERISITPWLIHTRKSLLQNAIGNFIAYAINPIKYCDFMEDCKAPGRPTPTPELCSLETGYEPPKTRRASFASASL